MLDTFCKLEALKPIRQFELVGEKNMKNYSTQNKYSKTQHGTCLFVRPFECKKQVYDEKENPL